MISSRFAIATGAMLTAAGAVACAETVAVPPPVAAPGRSDAAFDPSTRGVTDTMVDGAPASHASDVNDAPDASDARDMSDASAHGGLSPNQIRSVVMDHLLALRVCDERVASKRAPPPEGGLAVGWQIAASGVVTSASVVDVQSTIDIPDLKTCILHEVRDWQFPRSDRASTVTSWPFRFGADSSYGIRR